ncbi:MAG: cation:proton antiporter [Betaproteobacteria bacterium]|nr:cation:proton antiporter [Betaproteobacteria bacterium]
MSDVSIIATLAGALAVALVFGWATQRIGLSTLVGYMLAGIVVGPYTPGFVADAQLASQMAEIGVILLMFGVGMHFHPQELIRVWRLAVPGAVAQSAVAAAVGWAGARAFGWSHGAGVVFGMALAVASTVVLMRMLVERDRLSARDGHVAVGWLIVEDLFTVVALVVLPALATGRASAAATASAVGLAMGKAAVFAVLIWALGTPLLGHVMERIAKTRSTELFTLTVFTVALGVALLAAEVFQISVALGAFFAGLVVGQSRFGVQAAADMVPFRDVFSALFFVSVGMLFNPEFVISQPVMVLTALAIVLVVKPLVALTIVMLLRDTLRTALTVAVGLAQIGEFSFILATLGTSLTVLPPAGMDALIAAAIVSIALNPLLFRAAQALSQRLPRGADEGREAAVPEVINKTSERPAPVLVTGLGELGRRLVPRCADNGVPVRVIDNELESLEWLRSRGIATVFGDPGRPDVLRAAGVADARMIVVTSASLAEKMRTCIAAREVNPRIAIVAIAGSEAERAWLEEFGAAFVCNALDEMTDALLRSIRSGL